MSENILETVKKAIQKNVIAREQYNKSMLQAAEKLGYLKAGSAIVDDEKQELAMPASEEEIKHLESTIGMKLPPSYRAFLRLHNGWKMVDGSPDFFSISQILDYMSSKDHFDLMKNASIRNDDFVKNSLVIGASMNSPDIYLLNPDKINSEGEWEFIDYDKLDYETYPSFLDFLIDSEKIYNAPISIDDSDDYFDPFK